MVDDDKKLAAEAAVAEVRPGMLVGLGTGSTTAFAIDRLGVLMREGLRIEAVATSVASERRATALGIPVRDFARVTSVDLAIDGADEIDPALRAIKGAGGAMLREKVVASAAARMIVVADGSKRVEALGGAAIPVEVVPFADAFVRARLGELFDDVAPRMVGGERYVTDNGNLVLDGRGARDRDWPRLAVALAAIPGVAGHGLFLSEVDAAYVAADGIVSRLERSRAAG